LNPGTPGEKKESEKSLEVKSLRTRGNPVKIKVISHV
jgi:hypothetical protein